MEFLSDPWIAALDEAARGRTAGADDPLASVDLTIDQVITDGPCWRLSIEGGEMRIDGTPEGEADVRLVTDRRTAEDIAAGRRPALDAFIAGDLRLGGDVGALLDNRAALEALGDLFAEVRARTDYGDPPRSAR